MLSLFSAAYMSYPITFILRAARAGRLKDSAHVIEKLARGNDGNMATAVSPLEWLEVVRDNADYISEHYTSLDEQFGWYSVLKYYQQLENPHNIQLMEFDDKMDQSRLVYGIGMNTSLKRITVIFRGTYGENTRDWVRNLQFSLVEIVLPAVVEEILDGTSTTKLYVHRGIFEYLFGYQSSSSSLGCQQSSLNCSLSAFACCSLNC